MVFFSGSFFYSARKIPGLEMLPVTLCDGTATRGDTMRCVGFQHFTGPEYLQPKAAAAQGANQIRFDGLRCKNCTRTFPNDTELLQHCRDTGHGLIVGDDDKDDQPVPATTEIFVSFVNMAMQRAMGEVLTRWGREYVDKTAPTEATDRRGNPLGVAIFQAIALSFGVMRIGNKPPTLALTCDLRAKVIRTTSVLDAIYSDGYQALTPQSVQQAERRLTVQQRKQLERSWIGEVVIYKSDKTCTYKQCRVGAILVCLRSFAASYIVVCFCSLFLQATWSLDSTLSTVPTRCLSRERASLTRSILPRKACI